jgi:hypothetical protein
VLVHRRAGATRTEAKQREDAPGVAVPATFAKTRIDSLLTVEFSNSYWGCTESAIVTVTKTQPDARRRDEGAGEENTMRGTVTAGQTPSTRAIRRRVPTIALWALQALLAIIFAVAKVFGDPAMVGDGGQRLHRWACLRGFPTTCPRRVLRGRGWRKDEDDRQRVRLHDRTGATSPRPAWRSASTRWPDLRRGLIASLP